MSVIDIGEKGFQGEHAVPLKLGAMWRGRLTPVMELLLQGLRTRAAVAKGTA